MGINRDRPAIRPTVAPETKRWLKSRGRPMGRVIDELVRAEARRLAVRKRTLIMRGGG